MPVKIPKGFTLTIFEEPRVESSFPDLVLVLWDKEVTRNWHASRALLDQDDIKILHCIYLESGSTDSRLETIFPSSLASRLDKLFKAGLIYRRGGKIWGGPLSTNFAVKRIVAIEAKIKDVKSGIEQAILNTWFAHESMLLLPQNTKDSTYLALASQMKIVIYTKEQRETIKISGADSRPLSYASWLFNEWVWKTEQIATGGV